MEGGNGNLHDCIFYQYSVITITSETARSRSYKRACVACNHQGGELKRLI